MSFVPSPSVSDETSKGATVYASDLGASPDLADNHDYIALAIAQCSSAGGGRVILSRGTYTVLSELQIAHTNVILQGAGRESTKIIAGGPMRSVLALLQSDCKVIDLCLDAAVLATYAGYGEGWSMGVCQGVRFRRPVLDGWHFPRYGINDNNTFRDCYFDACGTIYATSGRPDMSLYCARLLKATGTVETNGASVLGSGTAFLSLGIRPGDFIAVGTYPLVEYLQIGEVTDNTHLVLSASTASVVIRSGQDYSVHCGDGYHEEYAHNDSNINRFDGGYLSGCAGSNMVFGGLYGGRVYGTQCDVAGVYSVCVGSARLGAPSYGVIIDFYSEGAMAGAVFADLAPGLQVRCMDSGYGPGAYDGRVTTAYPPKWRTSSTSTAIGEWRGVDFGGLKRHAAEVIGGAISTVPVTDTAGPGNLFSVNSGMRLTYCWRVPTATTVITPDTAHINLQIDSSDLLMVSTPNIATSGHVLGDVLLVTHDVGSYAITFQDSGVLAASGLALGRNYLTLTPKQSALFVFASDSQWHLLACTAPVVPNGTAVGDTLVWDGSAWTLKHA